MTLDIRNKRWSDEEFLERRKGVLSRWPTGKDIDLDEAIEYHKRLPESKVYPDRKVVGSLSTSSASSTMAGWRRR